MHPHSGTVLAMEKDPNILKEEHKAVMEAVRDVVEKDFKEYIATHWRPLISSLQIYRVFY